MSAAFAELGIARMAQAMGALRQGVLYDLLGRFHNQDMREVTVRQFMQRYRVDAAQARRVEALALALGNQLLADSPEEAEELLQILAWVARLHEVGISVAHSGYHKHSAYILANANMPGFSRMEQQRLSLLALGHRGNISRVEGCSGEPWIVALLFALRMATLFHRSRTEINLPPLHVTMRNRKFDLHISRGWLMRNPLTDNALSEEIQQWTALGYSFSITKEENRRSNRGKAARGTTDA